MCQVLRNLIFETMLVSHGFEKHLYHFLKTRSLENGIKFDGYQCHVVVTIKNTITYLFLE